MRNHRILVLNIAAIITLLLLTLGLASSPVQAAGSDPDKPGDIVSKQPRTIYDQTNEKTANQKQALNGDIFGLGWLERPFDQQMGYLPYIDIAKVVLHREDPNWFYLQITVMGNIADSANLNTRYGVELDTDLDNRGEYLLLASGARSTEWTTDGVVIYINSNNQLGGVRPVLIDQQGANVTGYDKEFYNSGSGEIKDLAWARISPTDPNCMELAIKSSFLGGSIRGKFIWFPWTMVGSTDLTKFEFNDHYTLKDAGSPTKTKARLLSWQGFYVITSGGDNYPLNGVWGVDNTPRYPSGFTPTGNMPGLGNNYDPLPSPHHTPPEPPAEIPM